MKIRIIKDHKSKIVVGETVKGILSKLNRKISKMKKVEKVEKVKKMKKKKLN